MTFAYAGPDRVWRPVWRGEGELPAAIRVQLRDAATDRTLSVSTATLVHANMPADCVLAEVIADCLNRPAIPELRTTTRRGGRDDETRVSHGCCVCDPAAMASSWWRCSGFSRRSPRWSTIFSMYVINTATAFTVHDERLQAEGLARAAIELSVYQVDRQARRRQPSRGTFRVPASAMRR